MSQLDQLDWSTVAHNYDDGCVKRRNTGVAVQWDERRSASAEVRLYSTNFQLQLRQQLLHLQ